MSGHGVRHLDLFVTEACNLACAYCFTAGRTRRDPSLEACLRGVDWLFEGEAPRLHVTFWGGEPLLRRRRLEALAERAARLARERSRELTLSMPTNATLLDDEALRWIVRHRVQIFCSIDGDESTASSRPMAGRGGGSSVERAVEGLRRVVAARLDHPATVRMTVTPETARDVARNVAFFAALGAREVLVYPTYDRPWSGEAIDAFREGQRALARWLADEVRRADDPGRIVRLKPAQTILSRLRDGRRRRRSGALRHCGAGTELVALAADGGLYPCHRFVFYGRARGEPFRIGNLAGGLDPDAAGEIGGLRVEELEGATRCVRCELFDLCTLGCVAINWATTGEARRAPGWACELVGAGVEAFRELHEAVGDDPRLDLYLGRGLGSALRRAARGLGRDAFRLYNSRSRTREGGGHDPEGEGDRGRARRDDGGDPHASCP